MGLKLPIYAYYVGVSGTPTALASGGEMEVYQIAYNHSNYPGELGRLMNEFKKKYNEDFYTFSIYNIYVALSDAMAKAKSTDPMKVAAALEGLRFKGFNGESEMRKTDHHCSRACGSRGAEGRREEQVQRRQHRLHLRRSSTSKASSRHADVLRHEVF
jgi:hypothetical protein